MNYTSPSSYFVSLEAFFDVTINSLLIIYLPAIAITAWIVWRHSPPEMFSFRLTLTNGATWLLLTVLYFSIFFRPIPLLPLPVGVASGWTVTMGMNPNHSFYVGLILVFNVTVSFSLCLTVQFLSVAYPTYSSNITRFRGVSIFLFFHIVGTVVFSSTAVVMDKHALTQTALKSLVDSDLPELTEFIQGKVMFGFAPESPRLLSGAAASWLLFISTWWVLMVIIGLATVIQETRHSMLQKTHKMRRIVGTILVIRTAIPICTLSIPGLIVSLLIFFQTPNVAGLVSVICVVAASSGGLMCIPSIVILKPYRVVFLRLLCVPQIRRALNLNSIHSSSNASSSPISATISSLQIPSETRRLPPVRATGLPVEKDGTDTQAALPKF